MTNKRDLEKIEKRINALSRVVSALADKAKLDGDSDSRVSYFDLSDIRHDLHLGRDH